GDIGFDEAVELDERFLVEPDEVEVACREARLAQAVGDRVCRESRVVLPAREALLLRGGNDSAVLDKAGGAVVIVRRDAKDVRGHALEEGVDERRDGARLREDDQQAEEHEHNRDGHEPVLLLLPEKGPELAEDAPLAHIALSEHPRVVLRIAVPGRIRRPAEPAGSVAAERILAREPPQKPDRRQHKDEEQRQEHARVRAAQHARDAPPPGARPSEERRRDEPEDGQQDADRAKPLGAADAAAPPERRGNEAKEQPDRQAERALLVPRPWK